MVQMYHLVIEMHFDVKIISNDTVKVSNDVMRASSDTGRASNDVKDSDLFNNCEQLSYSCVVCSMQCDGMMIPVPTR